MLFHRYILAPDLWPFQLCTQASMCSVLHLSTNLGPCSHQHMSKPSELVQCPMHMSSKFRSPDRNDQDQAPCKHITIHQYLKLIRSLSLSLFLLIDTCRFSQQLILEHPNPRPRLQFALNLVGWDEEKNSKSSTSLWIIKKKKQIVMFKSVAHVKTSFHM